MLSMLKERLNNDPKEEIEIAADEQNNITKLRLEKLVDD
jgi:2-oxo-4-hydroxy-4-carboxy--5-ureidoimidazoline (OHCU) decarboxylase